MNRTIQMEQGECWYGGCVADGISMPFDEHTKFTQKLSINQTSNQAVPLLLSSHGRYLWSEDGFDFTISDGKIELTGSAPLELLEGHQTLKGAFLAAAAKHFSVCDRIPSKKFFQVPQYNTWIELMYNQNQKDILNYARVIIQNGFQPGILMIDCGWAEYYGNFSFHSGRFPDPKGLIKELHEMGFTVMLWETPFIASDSIIYRELRDKQLLIKTKENEPAIKKWWDGYSAVLDLTNPEAVSWLHEKNSYLMQAFGVDGFKLDAGDAYFYSNEDVTYQKTNPNRQSEAWALFAKNYEYNELRACFKCSGEPLVQRLADKNHSWDSYGLGALIPNILAQGILGYAYSCPDMIGGGEYLNFLKNSESLDEELFVRYAQCSALMPMMQFSAAPWRVLSKENTELCRGAGELHHMISNQIIALAKHSSKTGEPIVRYMEYEFPHQGFEKVTDQFMLGSDILVAPVLTKGAKVRKVLLPRGNWMYESNTYTGPCELFLDTDLSAIPFFTRVSS